MTELSRYVKRYTSISAVIDILLRKQLPLLSPQNWDDRNDSYFMELYKENKQLGGLYGLCATMSSETYHHWRVFAGGSDGACIEIDRNMLENSIRNLNGVRFGKIEYLLLDKVKLLKSSDLDRLPFVKRHGFAAEKEYRIVAETSEVQKPAFSVDFPVSMINKIYLNPWLPRAISDSLKVTLKSLKGCSSIQVSQSKLINSRLWKAAGDKAAGK